MWLHVHAPSSLPLSLTHTPSAAVMPAFLRVSMRTALVPSLTPQPPPPPSPFPSCLVSPQVFVFLALTAATLAASMTLLMTVPLALGRAVFVVTGVCEEDEVGFVFLGGEQGAGEPVCWCWKCSLR